MDWALQISDGSIIITETPTTGVIQMASLTVGDITLTGTATGFPGAPTILGTAPINVVTASGTSTVSLNANYSTTSHLHDGTYQPFGTYITAVNGTAPIAASTDSAGISTVSLTANYQTAGIYVTSVTGTAPITASGTTAITVGIDQAAITAGNAASAQATVYVVRNNTASTILKGTLVAATGAEPSGRIDIAPFTTTGLQDSELRVMGIVTESIGAGVNGTVMSFGTLTGLDTRGTASSALAVGDEDWDEGTILYAHPTVPGKLTEVRPQHDLAIAFTTVRHASTGQIAIRIVPGNFHLEWLHDVSAESPSDADIIQYKTSSGLWTKSALVDSVTSTSTTSVPTANAVRIANNAATAAQSTADGKLSASGDTLTGLLSVTGISGAIRMSATTSTGATQLNISVAGDTVNRFGINPTGIIQWGDGTNARDTNLYRSAANALKTDDAFDVVGALTNNGIAVPTVSSGYSLLEGYTPVATTVTTALLSITSLTATITPTYSEQVTILLNLVVDQSTVPSSAVNILGRLSIQGGIYTAATTFGQYSLTGLTANHTTPRTFTQSMAFGVVLDAGTTYTFRGLSQKSTNFGNYIIQTSSSMLILRSRT